MPSPVIVENIDRLGASPIYFCSACCGCAHEKRNLLCWRWDATTSADPVSGLGSGSSGECRRCWLKYGADGICRAGTYRIVAKMADTAWFVIRRTCASTG